jgi:hypothetical protein
VPEVITTAVTAPRIRRSGHDLGVAVERHRGDTQQAVERQADQEHAIGAVAIDQASGDRAEQYHAQRRQCHQPTLRIAHPQLARDVGKPGDDDTAYHDRQTGYGQQGKSAYPIQGF